jgi:hypothetical protein
MNFEHELAESAPVDRESGGAPPLGPYSEPKPYAYIIRTDGDFIEIEGIVEEENDR